MLIIHTQNEYKNIEEFMGTQAVHIILIDAAVYLLLSHTDKFRDTVSSIHIERSSIQRQGYDEEIQGLLKTMPNVSIIDSADIVSLAGKHQPCLTIN